MYGFIGDKDAGCGNTKNEFRVENYIHSFYTFFKFWNLELGIWNFGTCMSEQLRKHIQKFVPLETSEYPGIEHYFETITVNKKENLLLAQNTCVGKDLGSTITLSFIHSA